MGMGGEPGVEERADWTDCQTGGIVWSKRMAITAGASEGSRPVPLERILAARLRRRRCHSFSTGDGPPGAAGRAVAVAVGDWAGAAGPESVLRNGCRCDQ